MLTEVLKEEDAFRTPGFRSKKFKITRLTSSGHYIEFANFKHVCLHLKTIIYTTFHAHFEIQCIIFTHRENIRVPFDELIKIY